MHDIVSGGPFKAYRQKYNAINYNIMPSLQLTVPTKV